MPISNSGPLASPGEELPEDSEESFLQLEEAPVLRDDWSRQHPSVHLLFHRDVITHLIWCVAACRYLTGGADGAVKLWRSELQPRAAPSSKNSATMSRAADRPALIPEIHVTTLGGPVTDVCTADRSVGNSEVAIIASTDGTLTLCRTSGGEIIRTLRGARGESLEPRSGTSGMIQGSSEGPRDSRKHRAGGEEEEFWRERRRRHDGAVSKTPTWYVAEGLSSRLAPSSDVAVVRRPVYTVRAYREEARDVLAGPSNAYFQGLRVVAPTYAHLNPHEEKVADVLAFFSVPASSAPTSTAPRQWYASAITLASAPAIVHTSGTEVSGVEQPHSTTDPMLLIGFPQGLVQAYMLPQHWFVLHQHGETRREPPSLRLPVFSALLHSAAVLHIEAIVGRDLLVSISEDGTTQLRRLSMLHAPLRQLGVTVSPQGMRPQMRTPSVASVSVQHSLAPRHAADNAEGHMRSVTCCCIDAEHQMLITGGTDHVLCWWSLMAGSSSSAFRVVSLRESNSATTCAEEKEGIALNSSTASSLMVRGGFPIDMSLFRRRRAAGQGTLPIAGNPERAADQTQHGGTPMGLFLLVLDTERVVRIFDALTGKLLTSERASLNAAPGVVAANTLPGDKDLSTRKELRLARYDAVNGADRLLLGGLSLVPWYMAHATESSARRGHTTPVLFITWCKSLKCAVTADAHHILIWRLRRSDNDGDAVITAVVLCAWKIPAGIQSMALCEEDDSTSSSSVTRPSLFIAHQSEPLIGQYDCFVNDEASSGTGRGGLAQPRLLHRLLLQGGAESNNASVDSLAAATAVVRKEPTQRGKSATEIVMTYVLAVCHPTRGIGEEELHDARGGERRCFYSLPQTPSNENQHGDSGTDWTAEDGAADQLISPLREIRLSGSLADGPSGSIASVLLLPCARCLVMGGCKALYVAPLFSSSSFAVPCELLPGSLSASQPSGHHSASSCARSMQPTAVFPGSLIFLEETGDVDGGISEVADAREKACAPEMLADTSASGFLSRLVHIPHNTAPCAEAVTSDVCLVLSGSNDGLIQLWDVGKGKEVWQCRAVPTRDPITALAIHQCAGFWLLAVGDQSGVVTMLDITSVVRAARQFTRDGAQQRRRSSRSDNLRSMMEQGEGRMLDRWLAHTEAVSGVCFATVEAGAAGEEDLVQLLTTGEDAVMTTWSLPRCLFSSAAASSISAAGFPLFWKGEDARKRRRRWRQPVLTRAQINLKKLPWVLRQTYEAWRQQYVRQRLFGGKSTELSAALTRFYRAAQMVDDTDPTEMGTSQDEESVLLDRAWAVLSSDVRSLSLLVSADDATSDAAVVVGGLHPTMVEEWCVSLSSTSEGETPRTPSPFSRLISKRQGGKDCDSCSIASSMQAPAPLSVLLVLAFSDRCCDGFAAARRGSAAPFHSNSRYSATATSVRSCLRRALCAVVQGVAIKPLPPMTLGMPVGSPPRRRSTVVGPPQQEPTDAALPISELPSLTSKPASMNGGLAAVVGGADFGIESVPPDESSTTAPVDSTYEFPLDGTEPPLTDYTCTPRRRVGFSDERERNSFPVIATSPQATSVRPVPPVVSYRVGYDGHAPLIRSTSVGGPASTRTGPRGLLRNSILMGDTRRPAEESSVSAQRLAEQPFLSDGGSSGGRSDGELSNGDLNLAEDTNAPPGNLSGAGTAAAVVHHVNRHRRREEALRRLMMVEQSDPKIRRRRTVKSRVDKKQLLAGSADHPTVRSGSVIFGLRQCNTRSAARAAATFSGMCQGTSPRATLRKDQALKLPSREGIPRAVVMAPPNPELALVADTYLIPVLARVGAASALLPAYLPQMPSVPSGDEPSSRTSAESDDGTSMWYAERQHRRDVADEKKRLWNSERVMNTLLEWKSVSHESVQVPIAESEPSFSAENRSLLPPSDANTEIAVGLVSNEHVSEVPKPSALLLPPIVSLCSPVIKRASSDKTAHVPSAEALGELLHVSPTTAIDSAVRSGLPTRRTLQLEMTAAKMRMRETVRARAAHQREYRANTAMLSTTQEVSDAAEDDDRVDASESGSESLREEHEVSPNDLQSAGSGRADGSTVAVSRDARLTLSGMSISNTPAPTISITPLGKSGCAPRRALQPHEGAGPRRMATVPLPTATTREELFAGNPRRRK